VDFSEFVLNLSTIMMSKIVKAIDVEVNKRLEEYLVTFIKYNYENGGGQHEGFVHPSDDEIGSHISAYVKMTPFSLEEKVVEKKRMGRPKKNEKETVVAAEEEMFGNLADKVSELKLDNPNDLDPIAGATKPVNEKKEKAPKVPKEKKEKAPKVPKEKKEKVVKEKKEKPAKTEEDGEGEEKKPKEKKARVTKAVKKEEEENPWAINDDGVEEAPKGKKEKAVKAPKEKKEKAVKAPKEKKEKVAKEGGEGEVKKRGRPKKGEEPVQQQAQQAQQAEEDTEEEESGDELPVALNQLNQVASVAIKEEEPKAKQSSQHDDDEVAMEDYVDFEEEVSTPKTEPQDHLVKFTDKNSGKDYLIDKQVQVENEEDPDTDWYAVKDATTRQIVGRSNLRQMELFEEDDDEEEDGDEEEEEEEDEEEED